MSLGKREGVRVGGIRLPGVGLLVRPYGSSPGTPSAALPKTSPLAAPQGRSRDHWLDILRLLLSRSCPFEHVPFRIGRSEVKKGSPGGGRASTGLQDLLRQAWAPPGGLGTDGDAAKVILG